MRDIDFDVNHTKYGYDPPKDEKDAIQSPLRVEKRCETCRHYKTVELDNAPCANCFFTEERPHHCGPDNLRYYL